MNKTLFESTSSVVHADYDMNLGYILWTEDRPNIISRGGTLEEAEQNHLELMIAQDAYELLKEDGSYIKITDIGELRITPRE